jgi:hypothetical protein
MSGGNDHLLADWLTEREVAEQLKHHERTVARWRVLGIGPRYSLNGRQFIYHKADVAAQRRRCGATEGPAARASAVMRCDGRPEAPPRPTTP